MSTHCSRLGLLETKSPTLCAVCFPALHGSGASLTTGASTTWLCCFGRSTKTHPAYQHVIIDFILCDIANYLFLWRRPAWPWIAFMEQSTAWAGVGWLCASRAASHISHEFWRMPHCRWLWKMATGEGCELRLFHQNIPDILRVLFRTAFPKYPGYFDSRDLQMSRIFWKNGLQNKYPGYFGKVVWEPFFQNIPDFLEDRSRLKSSRQGFGTSNLLAKLESAKYPGFFGKPVRENARRRKTRKTFTEYCRKSRFCASTKIGRKLCLGSMRFPPPPRGPAWAL